MSSTNFVFLKPINGNQRNLTGSKILNVFYKVYVFWADRLNKMAALASDWLRHFRLLLWNRWIKFNGNLVGSKILTSSTKFVFFGPIGKTRWPPWPLIGLDIFDFSSETAEWNSTKLYRKQDRNVLYQDVFFRAISYQKWRPWPPIPQKVGTLYSGARYVALWVSCL